MHEEPEIIFKTNGDAFAHPLEPMDFFALGIKETARRYGAGMDA